MLSSVYSYAGPLEVVTFKKGELKSVQATPVELSCKFNYDMDMYWKRVTGGYECIHAGCWYEQQASYTIKINNDLYIERTDDNGTSISDHPKVMTDAICAEEGMRQYKRSTEWWLFKLHEVNVGSVFKKSSKECYEKELWVTYDTTTKKIFSHAFKDKLVKCP